MAKKLPYDTKDLLARSQAMLDQTKAEGNKSFAGSSYDRPTSTYTPPPGTPSSARGDEFAPAFEAAGGVQAGQSITETLDRRAGQSGGGNTAVAEAFAKSQYTGKTPVLNSGATEPTILTDTNIRDRKIPDINKKLDKLSEKGQYYDANGNLHNADGTLVEQDTEENQGYKDPRIDEVNSLNKSVNEDSKMIFSTLDALMKQTDQATASEIQSIKAQYGVRAQQIAEINRREQLSENTSLLLGGSSRYTSSADGISAGFARAGIMELAALDAQEGAAISNAESARADKNYQLASKKLDYVEKLRKEKQDKAAEISKQISEENAKMRDNMIKQTRDNAIVDLFTQGITDPADMLQMLSFDDNGNSTGSDITLEEIADTLKIITPPDEFKDASPDLKTFKIMQKSGDVPESWSFFDYKTALGNASRAPSTEGGFTETEKRKLEQAGLSNATRQEQLDHLYGKSATDGVELSPEDKRTLTGAGFSSNDISDIQKAVNDFGIDAAMEGLEFTQIGALAKVFAVPKPTIVRKITESLTPELVKQGFEDTYSNDQLSEIARDRGYAMWLTGAQGEINKFLASDEAKTLYADLLYDEYKKAGII